MERSVIFSMAEVVRFAIVLSRVAGIMVFAPFFNGRAIPAQVRIFLALIITLTLAPALSLGRIPAGYGINQMVSAAIGEIILGMVLGLTASFVFAGMEMAGQIIGFQLGFSLVNVIDPQSEVEVTVISFLENYIGLLFFLMINGHHWFLIAISDSLNYFPIGGVRLKGPVVYELIRLSSQIVVSGLQIAGPVVAVAVIADVVLGIIGRTAPQLHIIVVGMPLKMLVGISILSISFYFFPSLLGETYTQLFRNLFSLLHAMT